MFLRTVQFCWTGESRFFLADINAMGCLHVIVESIATTEALISHPSIVHLIIAGAWGDLPAGGCSFQIYQISYINIII